MKVKAPLKFIFRFCIISAFILSFAPAGTAAARTKYQRVSMGGYSFILPEGFVPEYSQDETPDGGELVLQYPASKATGLAAVRCLQEARKSDGAQDFVLSEKDEIKLRMDSRQSKVMQISATETITRGDLRFKFSILEEEADRTREVRGQRFYIPVVEVSAVDDNFHTMFFINDFRQGEGFVDAAEYRAAVTGAAVQIMRSMKRVAR